MTVWFDFISYSLVQVISLCRCSSAIHITHTHIHAQSLMLAWTNLIDQFSSRIAWMPSASLSVPSSWNRKPNAWIYTHFCKSNQFVNKLICHIYHKLIEPLPHRQIDRQIRTHIPWKKIHSFENLKLFV